MSLAQYEAPETVRLVLRRLKARLPANCKIIKNTRIDLVELFRRLKKYNIACIHC